MMHQRPSVHRRLAVPILVIATLVGASVSWFGTAGWAPSSVRATAYVSIAPLIGTYSNFEVTTHAADFAAAYSNGSPSEVAGDPDAPGPFIDSNRLGSGTMIQVTYVAESAATAESGLREHVRDAYGSLATDLEDQLEVNLAGVRRAQSDLRKEEATSGTANSTAEVTRIGELVADASAALGSVRVAKQGIGQRVDNLKVDTTRLTPTATRIRATLVAALTAFLLTGAVMLYLRNQSGGHRSERAGQDMNEPRSP